MRCDSIRIAPLFLSSASGRKTLADDGQAEFIALGHGFPFWNWPPEQKVDEVTPATEAYPHIHAAGHDPRGGSSNFERIAAHNAGHFVRSAPAFKKQVFRRTTAGNLFECPIQGGASN